MEVDNAYCLSSFLQFRTIVDENKIFDYKNIFSAYAGGGVFKKYEIPKNRIPVHNSEELLMSIEKQMLEWTKDGKAALALSGGIDSAILAKFMPKGSTVYTFRCVVPGMEVANEVPQAAKYAKECGLVQKVVELHWEDFEKYAPILMKRKGCPIHSIEVQIYKAALQAKADGFGRLIFGESADVTYGGMDGLLSKDWTVGEFIDRYSYVLPYKVLKNFVLITEPFKEFEKEGFVDAHEFCRNFFLQEGMGSYTNACATAGIELLTPYVNTYMAVSIDYKRIRSGENKYIVREAFAKLYPDFVAPPKLPMPRATNEWLKNWEGPKRSEFWSHSTDNMTGDQKWLVWAAEKFLDLCDAGT